MTRTREPMVSLYSDSHHYDHAGRFASSGVAPGVASNGPQRLKISAYPRWAELVQRALYLMPPSMPREQPSILQGVLHLLHEHVPAAWSLTVAEGNPDVAPNRCLEVRSHLEQTEKGWRWKKRHQRRQGASGAGPIQGLLEPATVAEHARLVRDPHLAPLSVYQWGPQGYIAIIHMSGITLAIRDIPGMPEANEVLITRESMEGHSLDSLDFSTVANLFGREDPEAIEDSHDRAEGIIDDDMEGMSTIPSAFMALRPAPKDAPEGILHYVSRHMRKAGPGNEAAAWDTLRASDQYRFNVERLREMVIPQIFETTPSLAKGADAADVMLLMGIVQRFAQSGKPLDGLGQKTLAEAAISITVQHLSRLRDQATMTDVRDALEQRLLLLAHTWMHHCGEVPHWSPVECREDLTDTLNRFIDRITHKAKGRALAA